MELVKHYERNTRGTDYVVGDIHGCFSMLKIALTNIGFDHTVDRLFSVGDLVDRGPESNEFRQWVARDWFHPVRGNHEQMMMKFFEGDLDYGMYLVKGGEWFLKSSHEEQTLYYSIVVNLPFAISIDHDGGLVGLIHAECPADDWSTMKLIAHDERAQMEMLWSRSKIANQSDVSIDGIDRLFVGHTIVDSPVTLGNVHYIDTGGFRPDGAISVFKLDGTMATSVKNPFWNDS